VVEEMERVWSWITLDINDPSTFAQLPRGRAPKDMLEANQVGLNEGLIEFDDDEEETQHGLCHSARLRDALVNR
jgi:hypothetical protein